MGHDEHLPASGSSLSFCRKSEPPPDALRVSGRIFKEISKLSRLREGSCRAVIFVEIGIPLLLRSQACGYLQLRGRLRG